MKPAVTVDISDFVEKITKAKFSSQEVQDILGAGGYVIVTTQKLLVPTDTHDTQNSIMIRPGDSANEILIGPSTDYAPYIEYGTSNPNYPIQPFVVPSGTGKGKADALKAIEYAVKATLAGKGLLK